MTSKGVAIVKILAVCSALGLGGGYVWQRQKAAAAPPVETERRTTLPGSKSMVFESEAEAGPPIKVDRALMSGSKSGAVTLPELKSRDSVVIPEFKPVDQNTPAEEPKVVPRKRVVLPGSKSIDRILQPPAAKDPESPAPESGER